MRSYPPNPGDHLPNTMKEKKDMKLNAKTLSLYDQETQNWLSYTRWFTNWRDIQAWNKTSNLTNLIFDNQIFFWVIYVVSPYGIALLLQSKIVLTKLKKPPELHTLASKVLKSFFFLPIFDKWGDPI
jgi:hypothetical protein